MLLKLPEWLTKSKNLARPHRAKVISNNDPKQLGRVKVEIKFLLEGSEANLPWTYPVNPYFLGGSNNSAIFSVPEVGSELSVIFPFNEIYLPFYNGYWHTSQNMAMEIFADDYPNTYGWHDSSGNKFRVNKVQKTIEVLHSTGAKFKILTDGSIEEESPVKITNKVGANTTLIDQSKIVLSVGGTSTLTMTTSSIDMVSPIINSN